MPFSGMRDCENVATISHVLGGIGWLHRKQGLSCDHVISAELATADGKLLNVSEEENPDLLWALKGAGQHFGVVTSIAYQLEAMEPEVLAGYVTYPLDKLRNLTPHHRELSDTFPDELSTWLIVETGQDGRFGRRVGKIAQRIYRGGGDVVVVDRPINFHTCVWARGKRADPGSGEQAAEVATLSRPRVRMRILLV